MLQHIQKNSIAKPAQTYVSLADLARMTGEKHHALYHFIRQYNRKHAQHPIEAFHLPTGGLKLFIKEADAEMICALYAHPEDYAEKVQL